MEFALSEDQIALKQGVEAFLKSELPLDTVREFAKGEDAAIASIASGLNSLGVAGLMIAEADGGLGLGLLEAVQIQEAFGYAVAPEAFVSTALAGAAIGASGSDEAKVMLPGIADGSIRFAAALNELSSKREGAGISVKDNNASGMSLFVVGPSDTTHILIASGTGDVAVIDAKSTGVDFQSLNTIDRSRVFKKLVLDNAPITALPDANAQDLLHMARTLIAADSLGACQAMLDQAVAYAQERKQFGRVIGSFQAVKHMCADMAAKIEPCRALVWHAAYATDVDDAEAALMACLVKSHLAEVGTFVARTSTEVYGGMGFTDLIGLHYWYKRIGVNRQLFGSPEAVRVDAARLQGWAN